MKIALILTLSLVFTYPASADEKSRIAISFAGFFNSETKDFNPRRIGYGAMLSYKDVYGKLKGSLGKTAELSPMGTVEQIFREIEHDGAAPFLKLITDWLAYTNDYLLGGAVTCSTCAGSSFVFPKGWGKRDRIYVVFGLETMTPRGGLRSGLTVVGFDGKGNYIGIRTTPYDLRWYDAEKMTEDSLRLILQIQ